MSRSERRHRDQRAKARTKWVLVTKWRWTDPEPRDVGRHASFHCATGRHRWCGCSPRYWKNGPPPRDLRVLQDVP